MKFLLNYDLALTHTSPTTEIIYANQFVIELDTY
jgi:hypothetical protein